MKPLSRKVLASLTLLDQANAIRLHVEAPAAPGLSEALFRIADNRSVAGVGSAMMGN